MSACEVALTNAKNLHIDECEAVLIQKKTITVRITDSEIAEIKINQDKNLGVRIIHQKKIVSAQTSNLNDSKKIIEQSVEIAKFQKPKTFWKSLPHKLESKKIEKIFDKKLVDISETQATDIAQTMINSASHSKVTRISGSLNIVSERFEILNSNQLSCSDDATYIAGTINADSDDSYSQVSGIGQQSCRTLDAFSPEVVGSDAAEMCVGSINPKKPDAGEYSVILEPYSVGELLAFVFAANFNLRSYSDKRSCFSDKRDSKIAVDEFSLIDDPHATEGIGSKPFDDEGVVTKSSTLIENGIFKKLYSDSFYAFKEGKESSGNASRPGSPMGRSAEPIPIPAPHNLKIPNGKISPAEIIKDTKKGLVIGRLWYTYAVNPIKGDFSCTARSGVRIIEDGKIKYPGSSVRIVHNLPIMLKNLSAIGNNSKNVLQWASLPSIAPTIKADNIKVIPI